MESLVLECKDVCKSYKEKVVLNNLNLTIESGKIYGLIGRNGVGKTTLLSIVTGQNKATGGDVTINGENVWENEKLLAKMCFSREISGSNQDGISMMKVKDYLDAAKTYFPAWDKEMADNLVKEFGLEVKKPMVKLSKGMLSMVTIIVALASKAPITILDEPVAGLDVFSRKKFYQLILDEYSETQRTFIISTHIIEEAADIFEEVIILDNGKVICKENTQELIDRTVRVTGLESEVDKAVRGLSIIAKERTGRGMAVTVSLKDGQSIDETYDVTVNTLGLSDIFVAMCNDKGE